MAFRASTTFGGGQTSMVSSPTITIPSSGSGGTVVAGDIAILSVFISPFETVTTPSGWTLLRGPNDVSTHTRGWLFYRVLTSGDPGTGVSVVFSSTTRCVMSMTVWSGRTTTGMLSEVVQATGSSSAEIPTIASVPAGADFAVTVARRAATGGAPNVSLPAGYTQGLRAATAYGSTVVDISIEEMHKANVAAGSHGGETPAVDVSSVGVHYAVALPQGTTALTTSAGFSGTGTLASSPTGMTASQSAALSGSGTLAAQPVPSVARAAALSGSGTLTAQPVPSVAGAAALSGSGTLTAAVVAGWTRAAALSGIGTLTANIFGYVTPQLSGQGTLTADPRPGYIRAAALSGSGTLTAAARMAVTRAAALSGSGTLSATIRAAMTRAAAFTGTGTLSAIATGRFRYAVWNGFMYRPITPKVWDGTTWRTDIPVTVEPSDS